MDHKLDTHLSASEMTALLERIGFAGILRAVAVWSEGRRPKGNFRTAKSWMVVVAGRAIAHRSLVALACELCGEREMQPNNFGLENDTVCKKWFQSEGFSLESTTSASSPG